MANKTARSRKPTQFKKWRLYRQLTQQKLADRIGMTKTRVSLKERGIEPYDQDYLEALSEALTAPITALLATDPFEEDDLYAMIDSMAPVTRERALEVVRALKIAERHDEPNPAAAPVILERRRKAS